MRHADRSIRRLPCTLARRKHLSGQFSLLHFPLLANVVSSVINKLSAPCIFSEPNSLGIINEAREEVFQVKLLSFDVRTIVRPAVNPEPFIASLMRPKAIKLLPCIFIGC